MIEEKKQVNNVTHLLGFDTTSEVFIDKGRVLRGIYPDYSDLYRKILHICEENSLFSSGIVPTHELSPHPYSNSPYKLVLEHDRIPFISYPHEWTAAMYKDAALFHIRLFRQLNRYGLTIKDFHPYNILFKNTEPVFVDFTSIIPSEALVDEEYLKPKHVRPLLALLERLGGIESVYYYQMYQSMFLPYFLLPMYLMQQGRHKYMRTRLLSSTLNASRVSTINTMEFISYAIVHPCRWKDDIFGYMFHALLRIIYFLKKNKTKAFIHLEKEVNTLRTILVNSGYSSYYKTKKEEYGFEPSPDWTEKHHGVYEAIRELKPSTVLDIGCNTGWFSILASNMGCQVVAIDEDEACIDILYDRSKRDKLNILPLVITIVSPTEDIYPDSVLKNGKYPDKDNIPLLLAANKRLKCDMVLALALSHHLVLGKGWSFTRLVESLASYSNKYLILEFVPLSDERIVQDPGFFPAFNSNPNMFTWYTQENLYEELKRYYTSIKVQDSFPKPRILFVCHK